MTEIPAPRVVVDVDKLRDATTVADVLASASESLVSFDNRGVRVQQGARVKWILSVGLAVLFLGVMAGFIALSVVFPWLPPVSLAVALVAWFIHDCVLR